MSGGAKREPAGPGAREPGTRGPVDIADVASAAGVSITTVSHTFSGHRHVSEATRRRVQEVAEELGYRPRGAARALATGRSMTLALSYSMGSDELAAYPDGQLVLARMSEIAVAAGYAFILVPANLPGGASMVRLVEERRIDGAILLDPTPDDAFVQAVMEREMPVVAVGRLPAYPDMISVDNDHQRTVEDVLAHLVERGYERPALLTPEIDISFVDDLVSEFERRAPAGSPIRAGSDGTMRSGYDLAAALLDDPKRPDSFFCLSAALALGVEYAASERNVRIPCEVGIVCMNDNFLARDAPVPITAVQEAPEKIGSLLVELILAYVEEGERPASPDLLRTELVPRESTNRAA